MRAGGDRNDAIGFLIVLGIVDGVIYNPVDISEVLCVDECRGQSASVLIHIEQIHLSILLEVVAGDSLAQELQVLSEANLS